MNFTHLAVEFFSQTPSFMCSPVKGTGKAIFGFYGSATSCQESPMDTASPYQTSMLNKFGVAGNGHLVSPPIKALSPHQGKAHSSNGVSKRPEHLRLADKF